MFSSLKYKILGGQKGHPILRHIYISRNPKKSLKNQSTREIWVGLGSVTGLLENQSNKQMQKNSQSHCILRASIRNLIGLVFSLGIVTGFLGNQSHFLSWASQPKVIWPWPSCNKEMWRVFWKTNHKPYHRFGRRQPNHIHLQSRIPLKNIWLYFSSTAMGKEDFIFGCKYCQTQQMSNRNWCFSSSFWASFCRVAEQHHGSTEHHLTI